MNDLRHLKLEKFILVAALATALTLRLLNLGASPLSESEAGHALYALQTIRAPAAAPEGIAVQPAYTFLTGAGFMLFGATDFMARFIPALSGALLVLVPFLFRRRIGKETAGIIAFGLAVDPGLVTVARQAGGPMPAIAFSLLALGLWQEGRIRLAGVCAGLALLSGPVVWPGLAAFVLAAGLIRRFTRRAAEETPSEEAPWPAVTAAADDLDFARRRPYERSLFALAAGITFLLVGTGFLRYPQLLSDFIGSLTTYLGGWLAEPAADPAALLWVLLTYLPLALIFALVHAGRLLFTGLDLPPQNRWLTAFLLLWAGLGLILTLVYPARQVSDLAWVIVPLWMAAGNELRHYLPAERPHVMTVLQCLLVIFLACFFWLTLITSGQIMAPNISWGIVQAVVLGGILLLGGLTTALVALGWSWQISRDGLVWGTLAAFGIYTISALWGAAQLRPNQPVEFWGNPPGPGQIRLLMATVRELSRWSTGLSNTVEIVSLVDTPSVRWELRNFAKARFVQQLSSAETPAIVITRISAETPELTANYRGQDFVWWIRPGWTGALPLDLKDWLTDRRAPAAPEHVILWARSDLFPGAAQTGHSP